MRKINVLKFYYKYENDKLPKYFQKRQFVLNLNSEIHNSNTRNKNNIYILRTNHELAKKCLRISNPHTVNSIPTNICDKIKTHSMQIFVNDINTLYLGNYKLQCSIANRIICNKG